MAHASPSKFPNAENDIIPIRDKLQLLCYFLNDPYTQEGARAEKLNKTMQEVIILHNSFSRRLKAVERRNALLLNIPGADLLDVSMEEILGKTPEEAP
ncbi:uncharacterized protein V6R79_021520 [Siganus canaliculatus]